MNELQQFLKMLERSSVKHERLPENDWPRTNLDERVATIIHVPDGGKGYSFFFSDWCFDKGGNLIEVIHGE